MNVKPGDFARVVESIDGLAVGRTVEVLRWEGEHSKLGTIWHCRCTDPLVTEYGAVGNEADFADAWLERIDPAANDDKFVKEEHA